MPKRKDQKDTLTNLAELQNDPGRARGQDFKVNNENPERNKYAAKDKGKSAYGQRFSARKPCSCEK